MIGLSSIYPLLRPLLHRWFLLTRGLTLGVRAVILDRDGRVLLIRHTYVAGWQFPGGGVEIGEDAEMAILREVREEANIAAVRGRLHGAFYNRRLSRRDHVLVFVVEQFEVLGPKLPDREIAEARFFSVEALPADTTPGTRRRLDEILTGAPPAADW